MTGENSGSSGLFYSGTKEEVRLGDRVRIRRWLRKPLEGVVCYIPGLSPRHPELEYGGTRQWAIELGDGSLRVSGYYPSQIQPSGKIELVERDSDFVPVDPSAKLEDWGEYEYDNGSPEETT